MSWLSHLKLREKLLLMVIVPLIALLYFSADALQQKQYEHHEAETLNHFAQVTSGLSGLLHEMQKERSIHCGFLGSEGRLFGDHFAIQHTATDHKIGEVVMVLKQLERNGERTVLRQQADTLVDSLEDIHFMRNQINALALSCSESLEWYSGINSQMIHLVHTLSTLIEEVALNGDIIAYENLLRGKEFIAIERSLLNGIFSHGSFVAGMYKRLIEAIALQQYALREFTDLISAEEQAHLDWILQQPAFRESGEIRRRVLDSGDRAVLEVNAEHWFGITLQELDQLKQLEEQMIGRMQQQSRQHLYRAQSLFRIYLLVVIAALLTTLWVAWRMVRDILRSVDQMQRAVQQLVDQGDFSVRVDLDNRDEIGQIGTILNTLFSAQQKIIGESSRVVTSLAEGRFDQHIDAHYAGDLLHLKEGINCAVDGLKRHTHAISQQGHELQRIIASIDQGLVVVDKQNTILKINPKLVQLMEMAEPELVGQPVSVLFGAHSEEERGGGVDYLISLFRSRIQVLHDQDHQQFHQMLEQAPVPLLVADISGEEVGGKVFLVSREFESQFGYSGAALQGRPLESLLPVEDLERLHRWMMEAEGELISDRYHHYRWYSTEGAWVDSSVSLVRIFCEGRTHVVIQINTQQTMDWALVKLTPFGKLFAREEDPSLINMELITARQERIPVQVTGSVLYEEAAVHGAVLVVHDLREILRVHQAKDDFLASVSHELRTPLTSIIGNSEILAESMLDEDQHGLLRSVEVSSKTLLALINDILDISKVDAGKFEIDQFELTRMVGEVEQIISTQAQDAGIHFQVWQKIFPTHQLLGDGRRIAQILINLLGNAIKFTNQGTVTLTIWLDQQLHFLVEDDGIGMSEEVMERIFKPFEQADSSISKRYGGTGLGLHISWILAERMGGDITVESRDGEGSRFQLNIPWLESELQVLEEIEDEDTVALARFHGTVLVAEDTPELQVLERRILEMLGATVTLVNNGREAVEQALQEPFDLILMDMQMPEMDGIEATKQLRMLGNETPVIALTANVMQQHKDAFHSAGCDGFLGKPINRKELQQVLKQYLATDPTVQPVQGAESEIIDEELVILFLKRLESQREELVTALEQQNWERMRLIGHNLKGSGALFGYPKLTRTGKQLCDAIHQHQHDLAIEQAQMLLDQITEAACLGCADVL